jgi:hypothetical protein
MRMAKLEDEANAAPLESAPAVGGELPYAVELWDLPRRGPERVIGRAASMIVAHAIFTAAQAEHLGRRLVLRRGSQILLESG